MGDGLILERRQGRLGRGPYLSLWDFCGGDEGPGRRVEPFRQAGDEARVDEEGGTTRSRPSKKCC